MNSIISDGTKESLILWLKNLQTTICDTLYNIDKQCSEAYTMYQCVENSGFIEDNWCRKGGGGGQSRIMLGNVFEKAGVNFCNVYGDTATMCIPYDAKSFWITGLSMVIHPRNPFLHPIHMNIRFMVTELSACAAGVIDLSPIYHDESDTLYFHNQLQDICNRFDKNYYPDFKKQCDEYFYIPHRNEHRGVGGLFFDELPFDNIESHNVLFAKAIGEHFNTIYTSLVEQKQHIPWSEEDRQYQLKRRGRYAEFNLMYDRGIKFGLNTGANIDGMFMSMPPLVSW